MRTSRTAVVIVLSMMLLATATFPVLADQFIRYKGTTSAASYNRVHVGVLKTESARRLHYIAFHVTLTCDDSSTRERKVILRYRRLDENGSSPPRCRGSEGNVPSRRWLDRVGRERGPSCSTARS
jgi:hypothetical protein